MNVHLTYVHVDNRVPAVDSNSRTFLHFSVMHHELVRRDRPLGLQGKVGVKRA